MVTLVIENLYISYISVVFQRTDDFVVLENRGTYFCVVSSFEISRAKAFNVPSRLQQVKYPCSFGFCNFIEILSN